MNAKIAISNVRDPLRGRFVDNRKTCAEVVTVAGVPHVDLIIQRSGGPYVRVRMDLEGANEIASDLRAAIRRAEGA